MSMPPSVKEAIGTNQGGTMHVVYGRLIYSTGTGNYTLTSNDPTLTIGLQGGDDTRLDFGQTFRSKPTVLLSYLRATHSATNVRTIHPIVVGTGSVTMNIHDSNNGGAGLTVITPTAPAVTGDGILFAIIGQREN